MKPMVPENSHSAAQAKAKASVAFTLLELLVVIAVIGVLASLLLPAVQKGKRNARRVECLSRQKQWTVGFHLYAEDNGDWLPREGYHPDGEVWWNNWAHVLDPVSSDVWYNAVAYDINVAPASRYALPEERTRFYQPSSFFHCPAARFPRAVKSVGFQIALFSIAMNSQLVIPPDVPSVRLSRVRDTTRTVLMLDNLLDKETPVVAEQAQDNLGQPAAYANRFAGRRHGAGGNIAFVDGSVQTVRGEEVVATKGVNAGGPILPPVNLLWETE
jgi:prepilin-type N-terminal cleavage/methylation domain-containing protein/prepilin-type processing-associated H-X9-DG protein